MFCSYKRIYILVIALDIDGNNSIETSETALDAQANANEVVDNVANEMNKSSA